MSAERAVTSSSELSSLDKKIKFIFKMEHMTKAEKSEKRYALAATDVTRSNIQEMYPASRLLRGHEKALDK